MRVAGTSTSGIVKLIVTGADRDTRHLGLKRLWLHRDTLQPSIHTAHDTQHIGILAGDRLLCPRFTHQLAELGSLHSIQADQPCCRNRRCDGDSRQQHREVFAEERK
jgi:hypothetical protein